MIRTETTETDRPGEKQKCARCGIIRTIRTGREDSGLCRDCGRVLSPEERAQWTGAARDEPLTSEMRADLRMQQILTDLHTHRRTAP